MPNMSSTYAQFIGANEALFKCMDSIPSDQFDAMSPCEQSKVCKVEADAVSGFLTSNAVNFRSMIGERLDSMAKQ